MTNTTNADNFSTTLVRVVRALAAYFLGARPVGSEHSFMIHGVDVSTWVPAAGMLSIRVHADATEENGWDLGPIVRTVTIVPGDYKRFEVIAAQECGPVVLDECRSIVVALGTALDYLTAPIRVERAQNTHDACAV